MIAHIVQYTPIYWLNDILFSVIIFFLAYWSCSGVLLLLTLYFFQRMLFSYSLFLDCCSLQLILLLHTFKIFVVLNSYALKGYIFFAGEMFVFFLFGCVA